MVQRRICTRVALKSIDKELYDKYIETRKHLKNLEQQLYEKVKKLPEGKHALATARNSVAAFSIQNDKVVMTYDPEIDILEPVKHEYFNLDPKTVNTLLSGKLLTDSEKRRLITKLIPNANILDPEEVNQS